MLKFKSAGYSLLELLVVVSIMGIVFAGGFASYRDYQRRQNLESIVRLVRGDLRLAQEYALAGKKPTDAGNPCLTSSLIGYAFDRGGGTYGNSSYTIKAVCGNGDYTVKLVDFYADFPTIQLQPYNPGNVLVFKVLGRGTNCADTPSCSTSAIDLKDTTIGGPCPGNGCKEIIVSTEGNIQ